MKGKLADRVAIVTGATSGIGEAVAERFAREGARVVLAGRRAERGERNSRKIVEDGGEALFVKTDVTRGEEVKALIAKVLERYGRVDILVNNAGVLGNIPFEEATVEDWHRLVDTDALGGIYAMWEVLPIMRAQKSGNVINVTSIDATLSTPHEPLYCFIKAGMEHLTRCLAKEYAAYGIRLNNLAPGLVATDLARDNPAMFRKLEAGIPLGRAGTPKEIADVAAWLASDEASFVTGATIEANGGCVR
ncbi:MAG: SDR family oxidoreductase [Clostridiales Family XIII bacterium]|jgi:NAD(P)-dependent dehydrogenase (short-subunit alcohol dehydrogenase family)|nr:SDR family oxidoreductase [Clostridiales Family XIII bacterium]